MTTSPGQPPERMRTYFADAQLRENPDLNRLAQLFIGMAQARARHARADQDHRTRDTRSAPMSGDGVESET